MKEQSSGLYAQTLAECGFLTIAFDPSYTGESSGLPRYVASPDINTEDFQAAVDYLISRDDVDADKIGSKVWLGARVTICPGVTIGEGAIVGAGAVVTKDVPSRTVIAGVPAKVIKKL